MATFGSRLKELRTEAGYTQQELAKELNLTISSIAMYETNKRNPSLESLELIADYFNCDMEYLLGRTKTKNAYAESKALLFNKINARQIEKKKLPIIGDIACGAPIFADEHFEGYIDVDTSIQADYAIVAHGDSMDPTVRDGDLILVDSQAFVDDNQKEIFATNLKKLLTERNLTQIDVAKAINVSPQTFNTWIQGIAIPRMGKIQALADYFCVLKSDLVDDKQNSIQNEAIPHRLPVYGSIVAGIPVEAIEDIDYDDWEEIPSDWLRGGREYFALRIKGDSMMPRICDGDVAIIRKQPTCENGDICAVYVNGYEATLKKVIKKDDETMVLQPFNSAYETMIYSKDEQEQLPVVIFGKLVELRGKF